MDQELAAVFLASPSPCACGFGSTIPCLHFLFGQLCFSLLVSVASGYPRWMERATDCNFMGEERSSQHRWNGSSHPGALEIRGTSQQPAGSWIPQTSCTTGGYQGHLKCVSSSFETNYIWGHQAGNPPSSTSRGQVTPWPSVANEIPVARVGWKTAGPKPHQNRLCSLRPTRLTRQQPEPSALRPCRELHLGLAKAPAAGSPEASMGEIVNAKVRRRVAEIWRCLAKKTCGVMSAGLSSSHFEDAFGLCPRQPNSRAVFSWVEESRADPLRWSSCPSLARISRSHVARASRG